MPTIRERINALKSIVRHPYVWPGGYPLFAVMSDGDALCAACCKAEYKLILSTTRSDDRSGWNLAGIEVNWEDTDLYCAHCSDVIQSAYGEQEEG
jgi:hypothetical protein